ncbi:type VI secretion system lipoprotein TssJ [Variovorax sp. OAS795]|uniref:type VI secretion system lipoprotein TssJ n=1 Tax=Variovorax sp. OAS795 TaxID=3034231 RepID=UPI0033965BD9
MSPLVLAACGSLSAGNSPPQKEQARLEISIEANRDLNLDLKGRGAPMLLRVYELKSDVAFQDADFFALQNSDKAALGADLLAVDQFVIRPGEKREIRRKSNPETTAIGFFAGYRDLPNAVWRVIHKLPAAPESSWYRVVIPANKAKLKVGLQSNAILLTDEEAGQRPVQYANESAKGLDQNPSDGKKHPLRGSLNPESSGTQLPSKPALGDLGKGSIRGIENPPMPP